MATDDDQGTDSGDLEELFEGWFQERMEREEQKKNRSKQPKDFGEFLDKVADAVWERGEQRAAERRQAAEEGEQPPTRGVKEKSAIERWWSGDKEQAS